MSNPSMIAKMPADIHERVMEFIAPRSICPLLIRTRGLEYQVVRQGGVFAITNNLILFENDVITERIHGQTAMCIEDAETLLGFIAQKFTGVNNRFIAEGGGYETIHIHFLNLELFGMQLYQFEELDPFNSDGHSDELKSYLRYYLSILGTVFVYDQPDPIDQ
jgi:hypothetical protein